MDTYEPNQMGTERFTNFINQVNQIWDADFLAMLGSDAPKPTDMIRGPFGEKLDFTTEGLDPEENTLEEFIEAFYDHHNNEMLTILSPYNGQLYPVENVGLSSQTFQLCDDPITAPKKPGAMRTFQEKFAAKDGAVQDWNKYQAAAGERESLKAFADSIQNEYFSRRFDSDYLAFKQGSPQLKERVQDSRKFSSLLDRMEGNTRTVFGSAKSNSAEYEGVLEAMRAVKEQQNALRGHTPTQKEMTGLRKAYESLSQASETYLGSRNPRTAQGKERYEMIRQAKEMADAHTTGLVEKMKSRVQEQVQVSHDMAQMQKTIDKKLKDILEEPMTHKDKDGVTRTFVGEGAPQQEGSMTFGQLVTSDAYKRQPFENIARDEHSMFRMYCLTKGVTEKQIMSLSSDQKVQPELMGKLRNLKEGFVDMVVNKDMDQIAKMYADVGRMVEADGNRFRSLADDPVSTMKNDPGLMMKYGEAQGWLSQNILNSKNLSPMQQQLVEKINDNLAAEGKDYKLDNVVTPLLAVNSLNQMDDLPPEDMPTEAYNTLHITLSANNQLMREGFARVSGEGSWLKSQMEFSGEYEGRFMEVTDPLSVPLSFEEYADRMNGLEAYVPPLPTLPEQPEFQPDQPKAEAPMNEMDIIHIRTRAMRVHESKMENGLKKELLSASIEARERMTDMVESKSAPYDGLVTDIKTVALNELAQKDQLPAYKNKEEALKSFDFGKEMETVQRAAEQSAQKPSLLKNVLNFVKDVLSGGIGLKKLLSSFSKTQKEPQKEVQKEMQKSAEREAPQQAAPNQDGKVI